MSFSTRARYGARAMVELAIHGIEEPMQTEQISRRQDIPVSYLSQLLHALRRAGLVRSVRGAHGGYVLTRPPSTISLLEILRVLEGSLSPVKCIDDPAICEREEHCPTRSLWRKLNQAITRTLGETTLQELAKEEVKHASDASAAMYYI